MIAALLGVARGLTDRLTAPEPARVARLLLAATEAKEATGQERTMLAAAPPGPATVPLAAAAAVARQELGHLRAAAGDHLERIDGTLGLPRVRTVRGLELALLQPAVGPPGAGPPGAAWATVPGLARRAKELTGRQLRLLEELTLDEPDPRRRQGLAGVGHLTTRLRRAAETLLVMTWPGPAGDLARPAPVATLLRAAVAETEAGAGHDQDGPATRARRVELVIRDEVQVDGRAGADLVHLVAELLDNAAAFSPPAAPVVVTGAVDGDGSRIQVTDRGLGMTGQELAWANQRLAGDAAPEVTGQDGDDRLGLLIVACLAHGHGFAVRLDPSRQGRRHRHRAPSRDGPPGPRPGPRPAGLITAGA